MRLVLFRLPRLVGAPPQTPVVVVEGERDVLTLEGLGLLAAADSLGVLLAGDGDLPAVELAQALIDLRKVRRRIDKHLAALSQPALIPAG